MAQETPLHCRNGVVAAAAAACAAIAQQRVLSFSPLSVQRVALGLDHSLCVGLRGQQPQLFAWGRNRDNVLGLGIDVRERVHPGIVSFFVKQPIFAVSAGAAHSLILVKRPTEGGGKVFSVGLGTEGRLGYPKRVTASSTSAAAAGAAPTVEFEDEENESWFAPNPFRIRFPGRARIARISCGSAHSLAISDAGVLYAWGQGCYGALGVGDTSCRFTPVEVNLAKKGAFVTHAAAGAKHSLCCLQDGSCWAWGAGASGRLGLGHNRGALLPTLIESLLQFQVVFVAAGESHSAALDRRGCVYTWGGGLFFRLGHGDETDCPTPRLIESLGGTPIMQIACGTFHTLAVSLTGALFAWGCGLGLGLGLGEDGIGGVSPQPRQIPEISAPVLHAAASAYHSAAVTVQGDVLIWGVGGASRLGTGTQGNEAVPVFIADLRNRAFVSDLRALLGVQVNERGGDVVVATTAADGGVGAAAAWGGASLGVSGWSISFVACGEAHTVALTASGSLWVWGSNDKGQLGIGEEETEDQHEPFWLDCFSLPVKRVACGAAHCLVVTQHGNVLCWGDNAEGQLGLGNTRPAFTPQGVSTLRNAIDVYACATYSACITAGIGDADAPTQGAAGGGMTGVLVGAYHEELQQAGSLWMWGSAESGKLGLGEHILGGAITVPHSVALPLPVQKLALALTTRGNLYAWGAGFYGRLGLGTSANIYTPAVVTFPTPIRIKEIAAGSMQSLCLTDEGEVWVYGWGDNTSLQACCGPRMARHLDRPELVQSLPFPADQVFTGPQHSIVKLRNGELYSWGSTEGGRLGVGWRRKELQQTPALVLPHWADPGAISSAAGGNADFQFTAEAAAGQGGGPLREGIYLEPVLREDQIEAFLAHLTFAAGGSGVGSPSWPHLQNLVQQEEFETRPEFLKSLEDALVSVLGRDIDGLLQLGETEQEMKQLESHYQTLLIGVASRARCGLANASDNKTPEKLQKKLSALQPLAFILQQQPAYLTRLFFSVKTKAERDLVVRITQQVYMELEDRRIGGLFCCLMRAVAKQEVMEAPNLMSCTSNLVELVRISLASFLSRQMEEEFHYSIEDILAKHGLSRIEEASKDWQEHIRRDFHKGFSALVNMCKKYESYLNLSAHDPIAKIVQAVGEGESRSPPFSTALIKECQAAKTSQSFKVDPRFLITEKNLVYCSLTHAPVPQRLALRQRAQTQDGQRVLAVLIRYVPPDACDCRMQLADCLRQGPPVSASSLDRLAAEFSAIAEHFASLETPDFVNAALFERRHLEGIQSMRREYEIKLRTRVETLKAAIHAADVLAVEEPIEIAARRFNFPLAFPSLRWKQHEKKQETLAVSLTFKYSVLLQRQV
ncbi:E3 ubiquitin-protein ligase HERC2 [Cyclospora cayetanensis]|uniref:E3 ubiquitin-protein ligase HERC2 n=1 Tax=Cyclospora cayetanensis TaxID=88456 RepID=A0A6P6RY76_9EIME|nr:E3 ubiquitin-protein ligase HERC2 [Cyclospora cayetanensis]